MLENIKDAGWRRNISSKLHQSSTNIAKFWSESDIDVEINSLLQTAKELKKLKWHKSEAKNWLKQQYNLSDNLVEMYDVFDYVQLQDSICVEMAPVLMLLTEDLVNCHIKAHATKNRCVFERQTTRYVDILDVATGKYKGDRDIHAYTFVLDNLIKDNTDMYSCLERISNLATPGGYDIYLIILDPEFITHPRVYDLCEEMSKHFSDRARRTKIFISAVHNNQGNYAYLETDVVVHPLAHKSYKGFSDWLVKLLDANVITETEKMRYAFWASKFCHTELKSIEQGEGSVPTKIKAELVPLMEKHSFKNKKYVIEVLDKMKYAVLVHDLSS